MLQVRSLFVFSLLLLLSFSNFTQAVESFESTGKLQLPSLTGPVVDDANFLSSQEKLQLAEQIKSIKSQGGPQIQILTVNSLQGLTIEDFSIRVAEQWKIGDQKLGNGVIITPAKNERETRIEVGEGIEGELTDNTTFKIINNFMLPEFKNGRFYAGLKNSIWAIASEFNISSSAGADLKNVAQYRNSDVKDDFSLAVIICILLTSVVFKFVNNAFLKFMISGPFSTLIFQLIVNDWIITTIVAIFICIFSLARILDRGISRSGYSSSSGHSSGGISGGWSSGGGGFSGGGGWSGGGGGFSGGGSSGSW